MYLECTWITAVWTGLMLLIYSLWGKCTWSAPGLLVWTGLMLHIYSLCKVLGVYWCEPAWCYIFTHFEVNVLGVHPDYWCEPAWCYIFTHFEVNVLGVHHFEGLLDYWCEPAWCYIFTHFEVNVSVLGVMLHIYLWGKCILVHLTGVNRPDVTYLLTLR